MTENRTLCLAESPVFQGLDAYEQVMCMGRIPSTFPSILPTPPTPENRIMNQFTNQQKTYGHMNLTSDCISNRTTAVVFGGLLFVIFSTP